jgi:hypothetical protein
MKRYSQKKIKDLLQKSDKAKIPDVKGAIFEDLVIYLFGKCDGLRFKGRNIIDSTGSRELDVAFGNNRAQSQFDFLDPIIICECKNEKGAIGANDVRDFVIKLRTCGANSGIIIASNGISGQSSKRQGFAVSAVIDAMTMDRIKIIVINRNEILTLKTSEDFSNLITKKHDELILRRTSI